MDWNSANLSRYAIDWEVTEMNKIAKYLRFPLRGVMKFFRAFRTRFDRYDLAVFLSSMLYALTFSYFMVLKHQLFMTTGWDLGIFDQVLYSTLHGKPFYYTVENNVNLSSCFLAVHFSPILILLVPFYAVYPSAITLLIFKSFALAFAAIPLYLLANDVLKDKRTSLLVSIAYLLYPPLHGAQWFDFQQAALLPLLIFLSALLMTRHRWKSYLITLLLILMTIEYAAIIMLLLGLYYLVSNLGSLPSSLKQLRLSQAWSLLLTIIISGSWFFLAKFIQSLFPMSPEACIMWFNNWRVLGLKVTDNPLVISIPVLRAFIEPQKALEALLYDYHLKFFYLLMLFAPLLFIPFKSKLTFVSLALLMPSLLSNYRPYYMVYPHYPLYVLPVIFLSFIDGLSKKGSKLDKNFLIVLILFIISTSPISPISNAFVREMNLLGYSPLELTWSDRVSSLHTLIDNVPREASILTQNHVFPHVSNRLEAYVIPFSGFPCKLQYLDDLIDKSEYIILDLSMMTGNDKYVLEKAMEKGFGMYGIGEGVLLLKRNYEGVPIQVCELKPKVFLAGRDLSLGKAVVKEMDGRRVAFYDKGLGGGTIAFGPYTYLFPGTYEVKFSLMTPERVEGHVATLDVATNYGNIILAKRDLYGFEIEGGRWINITLRVSLAKVVTDVEFRVHGVATADLYVDKVVVERLSSVITSFGTMTFNYNQLHVINGSLNDGVILLPKGKKCIVYGPYVPLRQGEYTVTWAVKIAQVPENGKQIAVLDVVANAGNKLLAKKDVITSDLSPIKPPWYEIRVSFEVNEDLRDIEFRLFSQGDHEISLAYVLLERRGSF